jgi:hypothetical protein
MLGRVNKGFYTWDGVANLRGELALGLAPRRGKIDHLLFRCRYVIRSRGLRYRDMAVAPIVI